MKRTHFGARILILVLCIGLGIAVHPIRMQAVEQTGYADTTAASSVYEIRSADDLLRFAELVNEGNSSASAVLKDDISLNNIAWTPIGTPEMPYTGVFDGQGHTISALTVSNSKVSNIGLFGVIGESGAVRNVNMTNVTLTGKNYVGGIAGTNDGTITNCHIRADIQGSSSVGGIAGSNNGNVAGCSSSGTVRSTGNLIGGIAGGNGGTLSDCASSALISGSDNVGGLVGWNYMGYILNSRFDGMVAIYDMYGGGITGYNTGEVSGCINTGTVNGTNTFGGIAGYSSGTVAYCLNTGTINGTSIGCGIVGLNYNGQIHSCLNTGTIHANKSGAITSSGSYGTMRNCYWLTGCGAAGEGTAVTKDQLCSGEAAFLLGIGWGQLIGTDALPVYGGATVYQYLACDGTARYSNTDLPDEKHSYSNGACVNCGASQPLPTIIASGWSGSTTWTLNELGVLTFSGSGNMKNYGYNGGQPWLSYAGQITSVVIEDGVAAIGTGAFMGLTKLENVTLPTSSLTKIGEAAFYGCTALKEITIPEGIYTIWSYTFKGCTALSKVKLPKTLLKIDQGAFENCTALTYVYFPTNVEIVGSWSFKGCTKLNEVDMTWADATEIREGAFKNCAALTTIRLPQNIQKLGDSCFYGIGATSFTVPDTVTTIEAWCFARSKLVKIIFGGEAPRIGEGAFNKITLSVFYKPTLSGWTPDLLQNYGGTVTWNPVP